MFNEEKKIDKVQEKPVEKSVKPEKVEDPKEEILAEAIQKTTKVESTKKVKCLVHLLNVRSNANSNADIVGKVRSGDTLTVSTNVVGDFYQVVEPVKGYVMTKFVG